MQIEAFSHPKARDLSVPADDVLLHIPGRMTGVFDGASDSLGRRINGVPVGRLAAMAAAQAAAALPAEAAIWPEYDILETLSRAVATHVPTDADDGPASTTAMIAFEKPDGIRMLGIGDTGFRINGGTAQVAELAPDRVSIPARVALFKLFLSRGKPMEKCEDASRACIGKGLDWAVKDGLLSQVEAGNILQDTLDQLAMPKAADEASDLIRHGLQSQFRLANASAAQLGYGVLNGTPPAMGDAIDQTIAYSGLSSIEIFSDGYLSPPSMVSIQAWEDQHAELETIDPHKIAKPLAVKGSTPTAFFDDRTVVILRF
jgi:hypothetical protein